MAEIKHIHGRHCASTGICNIVNFHGLKFSEAMCFGIGAGLGIWYMRLDDENLPVLIHVRSSDFEQQFFTRIKYPFKWKKYNDPDQSEKDLCINLDKGLPVILQTDIYYLPYFKTNTHFPGHVITVWDYNKEEKFFYITDTQHKNFFKVPFEDMKKARYSSQGFFDVKGNLFCPEKMIKPENLDIIIKDAIVYNSRNLLESKNENMGIIALKTWQNELTLWKNFKSCKWTSRFAYQVIEKRGTGGGGFRFIYSDFLLEASQYLPQIKKLNLIENMKKTAKAWQELAFALKKASEENKPDFIDVFYKIEKVYEYESLYHNCAIKLMNAP